MLFDCPSYDATISKMCLHFVEEIQRRWIVVATDSDAHEVAQVDYRYRSFCGGAADIIQVASV